MNLNAIPRGRDRARSISDLAESLRVSHRSMEQSIQALVLSGVAIVACERGVYLATNAAEVRAYAQSLRGRLAAQQGRISALEKAADAMDTTVTQETLWRDAA